MGTPNRASSSVAIRVEVPGAGAEDAQAGPVYDAVA